MEYKERLADYKDRYYRELDVREKIDARLRTSFSFFLVVFALFAFLFEKTVSKGFLPSEVIFWFAYAVGVFAFIFAIFFQIKALHGYNYALIPTPERLEEYYSEILSAYAKSNLGLAKKWTKESYEKYLFNCYVIYTSQNTKNNDTKALNLSRSLSSLIVAFVFVCLSYIPFYAPLFSE